MPFKPEPEPEEHYRIQNVNSGTYLEVRDVESGSKVIMRPLKEEDRQMVIGHVYYFSISGRLTSVV